MFHKFRYFLIVEPPPPPNIKGGGGTEGRTFELSLLVRKKKLLERGYKPEKEGCCRNGREGVASFFLLYSSVNICSVCGKSKVSVITLALQSFELAMQDFHPNLYSTKTLHDLYISDPF